MIKEEEANRQAFQAWKGLRARSFLFCEFVFFFFYST